MKQFVLWVMLALTVLGCGPSIQPSSPPNRAHLRSATLMIAMGVQIADKLCAGLARGMLDAGEDAAAMQLAERCTDGYHTARRALLASQDALDVYDAAHQGNVVCALSQAEAGLEEIVQALKDLHVAIPPVVYEAFQLADEFRVALGGGSCLVAHSDTGDASVDG